MTETILKNYIGKECSIVVNSNAISGSFISFNSNTCTYHGTITDCDNVLVELYIENNVKLINLFNIVSIDIYQ